MTLIQFDSNDPHEVLTDALPIAQVPPLTRASFAPVVALPVRRDGSCDHRCETIRTEKRRAAGEPEESILFVTFTDGEENQSREYRREQLFDLVKKARKRGMDIRLSRVPTRTPTRRAAGSGFSAFEHSELQRRRPRSREAFLSLSELRLPTEGQDPCRREL